MRMNCQFPFFNPENHLFHLKRKIEAMYSVMFLLRSIFSCCNVMCLCKVS